MIQLPEKAKEALEAALQRHGLRSTRQREHVYAVLLAQRDHPTADEVYARAKKDMPTISLATVYNCLETLAECELVKKLNYEREPGRFCPNDGEHAHFLDELSGRVYDILLPPEFAKTITKILPKGFEAKRYKISFTGQAPGNIESNSL